MMSDQSKHNLWSLSYMIQIELIHHPAIIQNK